MRALEKVLLGGLADSSLLGHVATSQGVGILVCSLHALGNGYSSVEGQIVFWQKALSVCFTPQPLHQVTP